MRWVLGIVGVLLVLVAIVVVIGLLLPKAHVAARSARYATPPDSLWASLINSRAFPSWRPELQRVETLPDENGHRPGIALGEGPNWALLAPAQLALARPAANQPPRVASARRGVEEAARGVEPREQVFHLPAQLRVSAARVIEQRRPLRGFARSTASSTASTRRIRSTAMPLRLRPRVREKKRAGRLVFGAVRG